MSSGNKPEEGKRHRKLSLSNEKQKLKNTFKKDVIKTAVLHKRSQQSPPARVHKPAITDPGQDPAGGDAQAVKNPDEDCDMVTALDEDNLTKLQFQFLEAARTNRCDVLEVILGQRACRVDIRNNLDRTALHLAAAQGCFEAVQLLVAAKAPVDTPDKHGMTPMFWAAHNDHVEIVVFLIGNGANVNRKTKRGFTLLHILAKADALKTLEALVRNKIIHNFLDVDLNDYTPLMVATVSGSLRATTVLSRIGSLESHVDKNKKNLFHLAVLGGCPFILEQLCKHEDAPKLINAFDDDLKAPIHYAIELDDYDCMSVLLKYGARVNIKSKTAPYPIITAAQRGTVDMLNLLIVNKAKISKKNFAGNTPLHVSAMANQVEAVRFLLRKGASICALNRRLQTPFNAAVEQGSAEVVELLILAGADMNMVDRAAKKPLHLAALSGFVRIVDMIIKAERWREKYPEAAADMAKKYYPGGGRGGGNAGDVSDDEGTSYASQALPQTQEDVAANEESPSISQAPTCHSDDDVSISQASTYRSTESGSDDRDAEANEEYHARESTASPPPSPRQYRRAESTFSNASAGSTARARLIERLKQQRARQVPASVTGAPVTRQEEESPVLNIQSPKSVPPMPLNGGATRPPVPSRRPKNASDANGNLGDVPELPARHTAGSPTTYSSSFHPEYRFLVFTQSYAGYFQTLFFYIAHHKLRRDEWKALARHWDFSEEHVEAIELQHTGDRRAYKEHGYRLLCIWLHGLREDEEPGPLLYTALIAIGRREQANSVQKYLYEATHGRRTPADQCHIS
uniref:ANK_REP_REGION domain-containing protein n=1 Tax=Mesocestoides corti TaxID=53468 RepID=A0A5K3EV12_MESCO